MTITSVPIAVLHLLMTALLFLSSPAFAGDVYEWTDENGNVHFADSPNGIPPKFQDQFKIRKFKESKSQERTNPTNDNPISESLVPNSAMQEQKPKRYEIPFGPRQRKEKRILIPVTFNDSITASMLLDTGATGMHISNGLAKKLGVLNEDQGNLKIKLEGVGTAPAILTIVDRIQIGGAEDHFIPTTVGDIHAGTSEGLIGMDFMSNYAVSIDTKKNVVVLEERPFDPDSPGGHDEEWWRTNFQEFGSSRTAWKRYLEKLDNEIYTFSIDMDLIKGDDIKKLRSNAEKQYQEADKLFEKLNRYAAQYSVPMHWRREEE